MNNNIIFVTINFILITYILILKLNIYYYYLQLTHQKVFSLIVPFQLNLFLIRLYFIKYIHILMFYY